MLKSLLHEILRYHILAYISVSNEWVLFVGTQVKRLKDYIICFLRTYKSMQTPNQEQQKSVANRMHRIS